MDIPKVRLRHLPLAYHRRGGAALLELCTCAWAVGPKLGRQPQRCKLVLHLVQGLVRRRRALSTGTTIARWSDRASWLGLRRRGRNHWLRVGELLLSCSPSVVSRGEHSGPCSLNWGSAPCGHMREITERRVAMARRLVNECVMIEFGATAVTRDLPSGTACQEFLPRMASFLWAFGVAVGCHASSPCGFNMNQTHLQHRLGVIHSPRSLLMC